ncbi:hypothetical protein ACT3XG_23540 [Paenibacillus polymyxa]|uniref:Uncharacterized protein n=1 Tax=Paenibacillus polymyxa TaxID=1406 RepID=A0A0F6ET24_PAEPO|nr:MULTISPECIES: hypothetical protein [Paenibacillus]MEB4782419.1 hypothetical protein [Paenibacillus jamilae]AHM68415.1 hypothetical protein PPSQR21_048310 [Paenibacillus polymyxa SQR-21]AIY09138.1 hypothetical protein LK13_11375 [Paenibacillus polymyxa]AJE51970.1 hypothetical protein RE92_13390 [Paenibacillus polymyxa]KAF6657005.1 hypothetical protein HFD99_09560 [Paenibacillus sp. EKM301P]
MERNQAERIVAELLERAAIGVTVKLEKRFPGGRLIGGKYAMHAHAITMYTDVIETQCLQMFGSADRVEEYFTVVLAHEIGHAADTELEGLSDAMEQENMIGTRQRLALQIEENAWNYALRLVPEIEASFISAVIDESLLAYRVPIMEQSDIA